MAHTSRKVPDMKSHVPSLNQTTIAWQRSHWAKGKSKHKKRWDSYFLRIDSSGLMIFQKEVGKEEQATNQSLNKWLTTGVHQTHTHTQLKYMNANLCGNTLPHTHTDVLCILKASRGEHAIAKQNSFFLVGLDLKLEGASLSSVHQISHNTVKDKVLIQLKPRLTAQPLLLTELCFPEKRRQASFDTDERRVSSSPPHVGCGVGGLDWSQLRPSQFLNWLPNYLHIHFWNSLCLRKK